MRNPALLHIILAAGLLSSYEAVADVSASAGSGFFASRVDSDIDDDSYDFRRPNAKDTFTMTSGPNAIDGKVYPKNTFANNKRKFDPIVDPPPITPNSEYQFRNDWEDIDGPGPRGSATKTTGFAWSTQSQGTVLLTHSDLIYFLFSVEAFGVIGQQNGSWSAQAEGDDPWSIFTSDLAPEALSGFDFLYVVSLESASYSERGVVQLTTRYETPEENTINLAITLEPGGTSVSGNPNALFYLNASMEDFIATGPGTPISLSEIQSLLDADVSVDGVLDSPLHLAIEMEDLTVPASLFADGSFAKVHVSLGVADFEGDPPVIVPALQGMAIGALILLSLTLGVAVLWRPRLIH